MRFTAAILSLLFSSVAVAQGAASNYEEAANQITKLGGTYKIETVNGKSHIVSVDLHATKIVDTDLAFLSGLSELTALDLRGTNIGDIAIQHLKNARELRTLNLFRTQLTDAGLKYISGLTRLETLLIGGTKVTSAGMKSLSPLVELRRVSLFDTAVDDDGLRVFVALPQLKTLLLDKSKVSDAGRRNFQKLRADVVLKEALAAVSVPQTEISCDGVCLRQQLEDRSNADQSARKALIAAGMNDKVLNMRAYKVDEENRDWLRAVLEKCEWPKQSIVGEKAAKGAWLIAQHSDMDPDFQAHAADKMKVAVLANEADKNLLPYLFDRNRTMQKKPQVYGIVFSVEEKAGLVFSPIEAPELLDVRRREIGLEPFVCYVNAMIFKNKVPAKWPEGVPYEPAKCIAQ